MASRDPGDARSRRRLGVFGRLLSLTAAGALLGLGVAGLTVRLEPELARDATDVLALLAWGAGFYGLAWLLVAALPCLALSWLSPRLGRRLDGSPGRLVILDAADAALVLSPCVYFFLLPQLGLSGDVLTHALFTRGPLRFVFLAIAAGLLLTGGLVATWLARRMPRFAGAGLWLVAAIGLCLWALATPAPSAVPSDEKTSPVALPTALTDAPKPVLLLCIDGADPHVMRELMASGDLPTFSRLAAEGTWGELSTLRPTLSPVIWTSLISGRLPADHGIHQFVHFRLPGVDASILQFPLHSGLNFVLTELVEERLGWKLRYPYTTGMRRVEALWNVVDHYYPVGVYRWLMTWPAEPVDGFFVSGGIAWAGLDDVGGRRVHPPGLLQDFPRPPKPEPTPELVADLLGRPPRAPIHEQLDRAVRKDAVPELAWLLRQTRPAFTAASFFPVDAAQHLHGHLRGTDTPRGVVVDALYRLADRRLGELLGKIDPATRVLVVSDHGFDFQHGHHGNAPPGVFFAAGEGIAEGHVVEDLGVVDVAPLVLRLLDLPVAEDMPGTESAGTGSGRYEAVLDRAWALEHPERRVDTWERGGPRQTEPVDLLVDPQVEEVLRTLGYVE